jgi:hypothetical protein
VAAIERQRITRFMGLGGFDPETGERLTNFSFNNTSVAELRR